MEMETLNCRQCHAELLPLTSFCRQCGAAREPTGDIAADERPTTRFEQSDLTVTKRLDPRPTAQETPRLVTPSVGIIDVASVKKRSKRAVLISVVLVVVVAVVFSAATLVRLRNRAASVEGLIYPGSTKVLDVVAEGGGRTLQLETADPGEKVTEWYRNSINPEKVVQLTQNSAVVKNAKATATIVREDNKTSILIKIVP